MLKKSDGKSLSGSETSTHFGGAVTWPCWNKGSIGRECEQMYRGDAKRATAENSRGKPLSVIHVDMLEVYHRNTVPAWMVAEQ